MSETLTRGYVVELATVASVPGLKDQQLLPDVVGGQRDMLAEIETRFSGGLSPRDALAMLINGHSQEDHTCGLQCVVEPILEERLPVETSARSLWSNQDFWLEDFGPIFKGLATGWCSSLMDTQSAS